MRDLVPTHAQRVFLFLLTLAAFTVLHARAANNVLRLRMLYSTKYSVLSVQSVA